ncbi:MAG: hypothetical protein RLZZ241_2630 [Bacteroidota bacterium]
MTLLLKSATLLDENQPERHGKTFDILIVAGKISQIAPEIKAPENCKVISRENLHISSGWFDSSVSFGEPGHEERETIFNGLKVAAKSGFTGIVLNTNSEPVPDTSGDIVFLKSRAKEGVCELFPMGALSLGAKGTDLAELYDMHLAGAVAFSDFKNTLENPNLLKLALLYSQHFGSLVHSFPLDAQLGHKGLVHEGSAAVRLGLKGIPALAEAIRVSRDLSILEYTGGKLHIPTISTAASVRAIADAKRKGLDVTCSVAIHNLYFTDTVLEQFDSNFKVLPPLRSEADRQALLTGLKDGSIDLLCSDHTPMDLEEKRLEFDRAAFGSLGLEATFGALRTLYPADTCAAILTRGRERFGIKSTAILEGETANITLFNPEGTFTETSDTLNSTSKNSMYIGESLKGIVYGIVVGTKANL